MSFEVLALVIGAVPIALPLVMQVTMAIGAASMAKRQAIVTHLTALQEIVAWKATVGVKSRHLLGVGNPQSSGTSYSAKWENNSDHLMC